MISNYSRNIRIIFLFLVLAAIVVALSPVYVNAIPPKRPTVTCPCNYTLEFWTKQEWTLVNGALFDNCGADQEFILLNGIVVTIASNTQLNCTAIIQTGRPPEGHCFAEVVCFAFPSAAPPPPFDLVIDIYGPQMITLLTDAEFDACEKDIKAIAEELGISCP